MLQNGKRVVQLRMMYKAAGGADLVRCGEFRPELKLLCFSCSLGSEWKEQRICSTRDCASIACDHSRSIDVHSIALTDYERERESIAVVFSCVLWFGGVALD
jgi:hypothetical protein